MSTGSLNVLNVGAGDISITFNNHDDRETKKAIKMLQDMQARGYAIMVMTADGEYARASSIDASRGRYILSLPEGQEARQDEEYVTCACGCGGKLAPGKKWMRGHHNRKPHGLPKDVKVSAPVRQRRATGIARSAGG